MAIYIIDFLMCVMLYFREAHRADYARGSWHYYITHGSVSSINVAPIDAAIYNYVLKPYLGVIRAMENND